MAWLGDMKAIPPIVDRSDEKNSIRLVKHYWMMNRLPRTEGKSAGKWLCNLSSAVVFPAGIPEANGC